jgi:Sir2- and TIR-associating SLOG family/SIR2-like domain
MTNEEISSAAFIREYTKELRNKTAAVFIGAGLSIPTGYLDWRALLTTIIHDLKLDSADEPDLVTIAQYHVNQSGGNRAGLTKTIFDAFSQIKKPTRNHELLAGLPIYSYWTTNYDKLIEEALKNAKKVPDVKYTLKQLAVTRLDRDVAVYKMHGDVEHATDAVICKDDYEIYPLKMEPFVAALRGDLIEKTFLFLGFSFSDPNIDYILSRVRGQYERDQRHHYCVLKRVGKQKGDKAGAFKSRELRQHYFIRDLKRFGIQTVLVDQYAEITELLEQLSASYKRSSIFVSGAAVDYGAWGQVKTESFIHDLSKAIAAHGNRIVTGFGAGIGSAVINGALTHLSAAGKAVSDEDIVMRPFPQVATGGVSLTGLWTEYRKAMIGYAGIAIFVFGNRRDSSGAITSSSGMKEEFDLCVNAGVKLIPIGATGFVAGELWKEVFDRIDSYFPGAKPVFRSKFKKLGDPSRSPGDLVADVLELIELLQRAP